MISPGSSDAEEGTAPPSDSPASPTYPHKVGPFEVDRGTYRLSLTLQNQGGIGIAGCLLFGFTMFFVLVLGMLSVIQTERNGTGPASPSHAFIPTENHFGFLWMTSSLAMLVAAPLYVLKTYRSPLVFSFDRADDAFYRNNTRLSALRRLECIRIREVSDPDDRYLYTLEILYGDGNEVLVHNSYEEREVMNLANEIARFTHCEIVWK